MRGLKFISGETQYEGESKSQSGEVFGLTYFDLFLRPNEENYVQEKFLWKVAFNAALDCLSPEERRTLSFRYGLMDGVQRSLETTAELMCITPEGVRKIILSAQEKLRASPEDNFLLQGPPLSPTTTTDGSVKLY